MTTRDITLWYIRNTEDPTFHSIAFKSQDEAQKAIDDTQRFDAAVHDVYSVVFPMTYDQKILDRKARSWVGDGFDFYSIGGWTTEEIWAFIDENHHGGIDGFIVLSALDV